MIAGDTSLLVAVSGTLKAKMSTSLTPLSRPATANGR
jgi:hypothetical protein